MNRIQMKKTLNSTINHIKSHPVAYAYAAGAFVGITATALAVHYDMKGLKLVDLDEALKRIHNEGLVGLKYKMNEYETLVLIPTDTALFTQQ